MKYEEGEEKRKETRWDRGQVGNLFQAAAHKIEDK